jgi:hypothetical protein
MSMTGEKGILQEVPSGFSAHPRVPRVPSPLVGQPKCVDQSAGRLEAVTDLAETERDSTLSDVHTASGRPDTWPWSLVARREERLN